MLAQYFSSCPKIPVLFTCILLKLKYVEICIDVCCNFVMLCSKRVILLRVPGAEVNSVTNSESMRVTCAYCHEMFFVSFHLIFSYYILTKTTTRVIII